MPNPVISVEHLSKVYRLGQIGTGTFTNDLKVWWARARGKPNPLLKIGEVDHGNRAGEDLWALRDVSFTVEQGEVLGVIGRNGAGKSTLLKILSRVTAPTSGRVRVKGRIASLLEVGTGFHPELTGRENIYLNGAILGMKRAEIDRKFDEIVDFAEIGQFIDTPVKRYSSGMYVRLAFAVAAHLESEILLVDEVLAVGDAEFQKKCLGKMGDVATQEGRTVLFVSHNMASIRKLCLKGLLFKAGKLTDQGEVDSVVGKYLSILDLSDTVNLRDRNDRDGDGKLRFTGFSIIGDVATTTATTLGAPTKFLLDYEGIPPLRNVHVSIGFYDQFGERVSWISNDTSDRLFLELPPKGTIIVQFERFPLVPGNYYINIYCEVGKNKADWIASAAKITVFPGDFYGSGKAPPNWAGPVIIPNTWDFRGAE